jgi:cytochrome P450
MAAAISGDERMTSASMEQPVIVPPVLKEDPYSVDTLADPYPFQALLRDTAPIVWLEKYGIYAVGRHASVRAVISDWKSFRSAGGVGIQDIRKPGKFRIPSAIVEVDPPSHTAVRSVLTKILSPIRIRQWRETFEKEAAIIANNVVKRGSFDGVTDVAETFIFKVFPDAMGLVIPREKALVIAEMRFNQTGPANPLYHAAMERARPYLEWFDNSCKREMALPGGIAEQVFRAEDEGLLEPGIASNVVRTLVGGGTDTTIAGIGFTLKFLAENPKQWEVVKSDPSRVRGAYEEALRMEAPSQIVYRTTEDDLDFQGYRLKGGTKVAMFLGAANRDPRQWENADKYDVRRDVTGIHLAFGHSIHVCLGQMLARLEAEAILSAIIKRSLSMSLASEPRYRLMNQVRALRNLPLNIVPA